MAASSRRLKGILSVTVLKANNLTKSDWFGENDCYAVLSLEPLTNQSKIKFGKESQQTEICQKTQIHDGCHPIFNEKFLFPIAQDLETLYVQLWDSDIGKDDLLAYGTLNFLNNDQGIQFNTNTEKEWLYTVTISMINDKRGDGGTLELVLHFIPETVADFISKNFNAAQAELKKKLTQQIVAKMTDVASDKIRGYVGIGD
ncbi:unnamed protein product [Rotaria sordida]|uniref:C2 domain-containing protein n=1 Tax=Rotaria sordida TaxID=392033 RepID=A0A819BL55_9BILA|nr:unnamed protein product [Rotaria sordida]CAF1304064.1 unnamed protein product [Rotaria sordida]CAF1567697.1 unnamed protein product [Rotaria sordida]CAF3798809.1 unnamed protein product [Rotaria sordida]